MDSKKIIDRDLCRKIKRMDQKDMEQFLQNIYAIGKDEALQEVKDSLNTIRTEISEIKGIGEVKLNQIMEIVEKILS